MVGCAVDAAGVYAKFGIKDTDHMLCGDVLNEILSDYGWDDNTPDSYEKRQLRKYIRKVIKRVTKVAFDRETVIEQYRKKTLDALKILDRYEMVNLIDIDGSSMRKACEQAMKDAFENIKDPEMDLMTFIDGVTVWNNAKDAVLEWKC